MAPTPRSRARWGGSKITWPHFAHVNQMYLATIETLAHAIDAKDQVTHGHIRRVQQHAMRLAGAMKIQEESHLRAIDAAALLRDMGKLAVPKHILNKPGRRPTVGRRRRRRTPRGDRAPDHPNGAASHGVGGSAACHDRQFRRGARSWKSRDETGPRLTAA